VSKSSIIYRFRIHTGQYDSDGEQCILWMGGGLIPDGAEHVWLTTPDGKKVLRAERAKVEPVSKTEVVESMVREAEIIHRNRKAGGN